MSDKARAEFDRKQESAISAFKDWYCYGDCPSELDVGMFEMARSAWLAAKEKYEPSTQQQEAEPVAWLSKFTPPDDRFPELPDTLNFSRQAIMNPNWTAFPLYLHPPAAQPVDERKCSECGDGSENLSLYCVSCLNHDGWHLMTEEEQAAQPKVAKKTCNWKPEIDGEFWSGECGAAWTLNDAGPKENNMHYCPECGGQLEVSAAKEEGK